MLQLGLLRQAEQQDSTLVCVDMSITANQAGAQEMCTVYILGEQTNGQSAGNNLPLLSSSASFSARAHHLRR